MNIKTEINITELINSILEGETKQIEEVYQRFKNSKDEIVFVLYKDDIETKYTGTKIVIRDTFEENSCEDDSKNNGIETTRILHETVTSTDFRDMKKVTNSPDFNPDPFEKIPYWFRPEFGSLKPFQITSHGGQSSVGSTNSWGSDSVFGTSFQSSSGTISVSGNYQPDWHNISYDSVLDCTNYGSLSFGDGISVINSQNNSSTVNE